MQNDEKCGFHRTARRTDRRVIQQSPDEGRERERGVRERGGWERERDREGDIYIYIERGGVREREKERGREIDREI